MKSGNGQNSFNTAQGNILTIEYVEYLRNTEGCLFLEWLLCDISDLGYEAEVADMDRDLAGRLRAKAEKSLTRAKKSLKKVRKELRSLKYGRQA